MARSGIAIRISIWSHVWHMIDICHITIHFVPWQLMAQEMMCRFQCGTTEFCHLIVNKTACLYSVYSGSFELSGTAHGLTGHVLYSSKKTRVATLLSTLRSLYITCTEMRHYMLLYSRKAVCSLYTSYTYSLHCQYCLVKMYQMIQSVNIADC